MAQLEHEFRNELELETEFENEVHSHHKRHRKHHHKDFLHKRRAALLAEAPEAFSNPTLMKKMDGMTTEMNTLKNQEHAATQARNSLEDQVQNSLTYLNEVAAIRNQIARTQVQIRTEERKLKRLEADKLRLAQSHHDLTYSLHHVMGPKIHFAQVRLSRRKEQLQKMQAKAAAWKAKETHYHATSLAMLGNRDNIKAQMQAAAAAEEKAHKDLMVAGKQYEAAKKDTTLNIQAYRFSQAHAKGALTEVSKDEEDMRQADASLNRLNRILNLEQGRVDESMSVGKENVESKIQSMARNEAKSKNKLEQLEKKYAEWQDTNLKLHGDVVASQEGTSAVAHQYAEARRAVLDAAKSQVVSDAEDGSDWAWNDWANEPV